MSRQLNRESEEAAMLAACTSNIGLNYDEI